MTKLDSFPSATTWFTIGMTIALIALVWAMGALMSMNVTRADAELRSESSDEYVSGLEARIAHLETLNANMDARLDKMERERARQEGVLSAPVQRDSARRDGGGKSSNDSESSE